MQTTGVFIALACLAIEAPAWADVPAVKVADESNGASREVVPVPVVPDSMAVPAPTVGDEVTRPPPEMPPDAAKAAPKGPPSIPDVQRHSAAPTVEH
jgi:hypothetical protein